MEKLKRDYSGEIFEDELTENQSMPDPAQREDVAHDLALDPDIENVEPVKTPPGS
jgi:hypothetical protein